MGSQRSLLVHALVRRDHPGSVSGSSRVAVGPVAAACTPFTAGAAAGVRQLKAHAALVQALCAAGPVVPFRFGTLVPHASWLRAHLRQQGKDYAKLLDQLEGLVEIAVTVSSKEDRVVRHLLDAEPELRALAASARSSGLPGQVEFGEHVAAAYEGFLLREAGAVMERLAEEAVRVAPRAPTQGAIRASFLVSTIAFERFEGLAQRLQQDSDDRLRVRLTGPLPPYSFVDAEQRPMPPRASAWAS